MSASTIQSSIATSIILDSGGYDSPLTITALGTVAPPSVSTAGSFGIYVPGLITGTVLNDGLVEGGLGGANEAAGTGIALGAQATLSLTGTGAVDGAGGFSGTGSPGIGGFGVSLAGDAVLVNGTAGSGNTISGGAGGSNSTGANAGGAGIMLSSGASAHNYGMILGGTGGYAVTNAGMGGAGAVLSAGASLDNAGTIDGGQGGNPAPGNTSDKAGAGGSGIYVGDTASLINTGFINGGTAGSNMFSGAAGGYGVLIGAGGFASNMLGGTITGGAGKLNQGGGGVELGSTLANTLGGGFTNYGFVTGGVGGVGVRGFSGGTGLVLLTGVSAVNHGTITGGAGPGSNYSGGGGSGASLTGAYMSNSGSILGGAGGSGKYSANGGGGVILTNSSFSNSGTILGGAGGSGYYAGIGGTGAVLTNSTLVNTATITGGTGYHNGYSPGYGSNGTGGVGAIANTGSFINQGVVTGGNGEGVNGGVGMQLSTGAAVLNTGTIAGGNGLQNGSYYGNGAYGAVISGGTLVNNSLIIGGSSTTFGGAGVSITGGGTLINAGTIALAGGDGGHQTSAVVFGGAGELVVDPNAVFGGRVTGDAGHGDILALGGSANATLSGIGTQFTGFDTISLLAGADWTLTGTGAGFSAAHEITGFAHNDAIEFTNFAFAAPETLTLGSSAVLTIAQGAQTLGLTFAAADIGFAFTISNNGGEVEITNDVPCFCAGTHIRTPGGEVAVEALNIGDLVLTADGRSVAVRWVGVRQVMTRFADRLRTYPIRIQAGALADGIPARDLLVSPDHAMFLGGILVQAGALVNGISITQEVNMPDRFTYYHIEVDRHALILAEAAVTESFIDNAGRMNFDNWGEYEAICADAPTIAELPYPRAKSARQLPVSLRYWLTARAEVFGPLSQRA